MKNKKLALGILISTLLLSSGCEGEIRYNHKGDINYGTEVVEKNDVTSNEVIDEILNIEISL